MDEGRKRTLAVVAAIFLCRKLPAEGKPSPARDSAFYEAIQIEICIALQTTRACGIKLIALEGWLLIRSPAAPKSPSFHEAAANVVFLKAGGVWNGNGATTARPSTN